MTDEITLLIAAVVNHMEDICISLLQEGAETNRLSNNCFIPLDYVSTSNTQLIFMEKLLEAKADPNGFYSD